MIWDSIFKTINVRIFFKANDPEEIQVLLEKNFSYLPNYSSIINIENLLKYVVKFNSSEFDIFLSTLNEQCNLRIADYTFILINSMASILRSGFLLMKLILKTLLGYS